ncbi:MAG: hypothetical protein DRJ64_02525 [Thermoprotei archaeon]|nr:MAG: hypothetical protein DRJ64_02525 [Thermoprotei archaeon]
MGKSPHALLKRITDWLALERNIIIMVLAVLVITLGEQMWQKFVPKYLEALGASTLIIGLYGSIKLMLGAFYQYPGGVISDKLGARKALTLFSIMATAGYILYLISWNWEIFLLGTFLVMVWDSMSQPALFSLIGEVLKKRQRAMGFSVQSILKRIPIIIAPPLGGLLIMNLGLIEGMKIGFTITILLTMFASIFQYKFYTQRERRKDSITISLLETSKMMKKELKYLLIADILARFGSYMASQYIVLYIINILGGSSLDFGLLVSVQMATAISTYLPAAKMADMYGRRPLIALTFTFFSLYTLALGITNTLAIVPVSFILAGLREVGEPARKALIVDLAEDPYRGRIIGLYYLIRELIGFPAPIIGGLLWYFNPRCTFLLASIISSIGLLLFLLKVKEKQA